MVECKRLKSYKQLEKRVKHANNQIKTRLKHDPSSKSRGMIALNITDIVNPNAIPIIAKSTEEYRGKSAMILKTFVLNEKHHYLKNRHKKCLAVITEFTTQGLIYTDNIKDMALINVREGNIYQHLLQKEDTDFLNGFWEKLGNQYLL